MHNKNMIQPNFAALNRRQALKLVGAAGLTTAMISSSGMRALAQKPVPQGQVIVGFSQEPTIFNPHLLHIEVDEGVYFAIFDPLLDVNTDGSLYPLLAREVPTVENGGISADGLQWRIHLRDDVKWHDGRPFTAEDVKFNLELLVDENFRSWRRTGHELIRDLTVVSPTEITWRMTEPFAPYASILASTFMIPKHAFDGIEDKNTAPFNNAPFGTGAFKWKNRVAGSYIELEANADYFGEGPYLERIIYRYIPDLTVLYTQFKSGDIDVTGLQWISADHYGEAKDLPGKRVDNVSDSTIETLSLNLGHPCFQDVAVRQAMYFAIDKASIIDVIYYGLPRATESYMPREAYYHNHNLEPHEYNLEKAKEILEAAGWKVGADGIREKDGVRLSFSNSTTSDSHLRAQVQQFLQQSFKEIGIEMTIRNLPAAVMWGDHWMLSQFESAIAGISFVVGGDPDTSYYFLSTASAAKGGNGQNTFLYVSEEVDALMEEGGRIFVPEERRVVYDRMQEVIRRDLPFLPIFQFATIRGRKNGLEGPTLNINNRIDTWNVRSWRWV